MMHNNSKYAFLAIVALFVLVSCSNEFELNEPKVETPIVYALLNASDANHYIRLERAFADPNTSALLIAQNPDSLYYKNAAVKLQKLGNQGQIVQEYSLTQVDGNEEGLEREDGIFATSPNTLYKISNDAINLKEGDKYGVEITLPNEQVITASADIIYKANYTVPDIAFDPTKKYNVNWKGGLNSLFHTFDYVFFITEQTPNGIEKKELIWRIAKDYDKVKNSNREFTVQIEGLEFFDFIKSQLEVKSDVKRFVDGAEIRITSGGEGLYNYTKIGQANLGITSSGEVPFYTNLSLGRGIFSSRSKTVVAAQLKPVTVTELKNNTLTKDLNFQ